MTSEEERQADQWWDGMTGHQRVGIFRWLAKREHTIPVHEDQATILDETAEQVLV
jgi:hypothetical protein